MKVLKPGRKSAGSDLSMTRSDYASSGPLIVSHHDCYPHCSEHIVTRSGRDPSERCKTKPNFRCDLVRQLLPKITPIAGLLRTGADLEVWFAAKAVDRNCE